MKGKKKQLNRFFQNSACKQINVFAESKLYMRDINIIKLLWV